MGASEDGRGPRPRRNGRRRSFIELCVAGIETGDLTAAGRPGKTHVADHNLTPENSRARGTGCVGYRNASIGPSKCPAILKYPPKVQAVNLTAIGVKEV